MKRRAFIRTGAVGTAAVATVSVSLGSNISKQVNKPLVISTWDHGLPANKVSWDILKNGGSALDAVEKGVNVVESDPEVRTVGIGSYPDREGIVTLDACIMDYNSNCGSVAFLQDIENPISVARKVMEETPHVMLVGNGAKVFAKTQGFKEVNLLSDRSKKDWENWKKDSKYVPIINIENHDTISSLALDQNGNLSGACTTSGAAYKMHGRVGDSPIIGAGLFVDNEVGAAAATGLGEAVIRTAGSAMVVEAMRYGKSAQQACEEIVERIISKHKELKNLQVGFIAIDKNGEFGAFSINKGFTYAICDEANGHKIEPAKSIY
jgi:isoaspartyl peptidase/L-asparaginase-like protein (Ntn-hydrolase superfamily)